MIVIGFVKERRTVAHFGVGPRSSVWSWSPDDGGSEDIFFVAYLHCCGPPAPRTCSSSSSPSAAGPRACILDWHSQMLRKALPWLKRAWMLIAIYIPTLYSLGSHHIDRLSINPSCASTSRSAVISATALDKC